MANEVISGVGLNVEWEKVERLGKIREDGKARPIRIRFRREEDKSNVIRNATKIRKAKAVSFDTKTVFITPDMTKLQRNEDLELRKSLSEKRLTDPNWIIWSTGQKEIRSGPGGPKFRVSLQGNQFVHNVNNFTSPLPLIVKNRKEFFQLNMTHFNAQGLTNKFAMFQLIVAENNYDVIAVSETWFDDTVLDSEVTPSGYDCYRRDRNLSWYPDGTYVDKAKGGV